MNEQVVFCTQADTCRLSVRVFYPMKICKHIFFIIHTIKHIFIFCSHFVPELCTVPSTRDKQLTYCTQLSGGYALCFLICIYLYILLFTRLSLGENEKKNLNKTKNSEKVIKEGQKSVFLHKDSCFSFRVGIKVRFFFNT